jgi:hypothetical protein
MEAAYSPETTADIYQNTRYLFPECTNYHGNESLGSIKGGEFLGQLMLNISRIFLKYEHFSYDGVNDEHMFTKQRFIAYCCNFILPPEAASCLTVPDI